MRAMISKPDTGITGLRPDLYTADMAFLVAQSEREVRAILAETESADVMAYTEPWGAAKNYQERDKYAPYISPWVALASSLAAFIELEIQ